VVDVTDGADVDVRLGPLELGLRHCSRPPGLLGRASSGGAVLWVGVTPGGGPEVTSRG
jgi:hypothetical protein